MLSELSIQGCLQFHLAIKEESILEARWNIFQELMEKQRKSDSEDITAGKDPRMPSELAQLIWVLPSVKRR